MLKSAVCRSTPSKLKRQPRILSTIAAATNARRRPGRSIRPRLTGRSFRCARATGNWRSLFQCANSIHADGQPLVLLSRLSLRQPAAGTGRDHRPVPRRGAPCRADGSTFYMLGRQPRRSTAERSTPLLAAHPGLRIVGRRNGYFSRDEEAAIVAEIARSETRHSLDFARRPAGAAILHCAISRPCAASASSRRPAACSTFCRTPSPRAPRWMQNTGLEWLFRLCAEPRRLFWRYFVTNPHALLVMASSLR